jgi:alkylation response protein AidB-like acyl-CoA dehydrogenase
MITTSSRLDAADHHADLRATLRDFLARHATTEVVHGHDAAGTYPGEIVAGLAGLGICGATIAEEHGGSGADAVSVAIICEELQRAGGSIASAITPTLTYCAPGIQSHGTDEQRARLLPAIAAGEMRMAIGLTEPDVGSDLARIGMKAEPHDGGFVVSGSKVWCTGAEQAEYVMALVRTERGTSGYRGLSMLLLPARDERVTLRKIPKLASQGTASCEVFVDELWVPEEDLIGELHEGARVLWSLLDSERVFVAAQCVGIAQGAFDLALAYARERRQFGRPVIEHQAVAHTLVDMATDLEMARLLAYSAVAKADAGAEYTLDAAVAKVACSERATAIVQRGMEVMGAYSYAVEYPMERFYREVKLFEIAGGTNQILRNVIAKRLSGGRP